MCRNNGKLSSSRATTTTTTLIVVTVVIVAALMSSCYGTPANGRKLLTVVRNDTGNGTFLVEIDEHKMTIVQLEPAPDDDGMKGNSTSANMTAELLIQIENVSTILIVDNKTNRVLGGKSQGFEEIAVVRVPIDSDDSSSDSDDDDNNNDSDDSDDTDEILEEDEFLRNATRIEDITRRTGWKSFTVRP